MTKFLNISTDTTLGGSSASDDTVSSQKAIKAYVDAHSGGGGSVSVDGTTISKNSSDELQAIGLVNKNPSGSTIYDWEGTLAQYEAQNVETLHPEWTCFITDDLSPNIYPMRNIGEIVQSTIPLTDAGLHLLDGSLISGSGAYSAFVDYIADLYTTNPNASYFAQNEWKYQSNIIPTDITSSNTQGFTITATNTVAEVYLALNPNINSSYPRWQFGTNASTSPQSFTILFPEERSLDYYTVTQWCDGDITGRIVTAWTLEYTTDGGTTWTTCDTQSGIPQTKGYVGTYTLSTPVYNVNGIRFTATGGGSGGYSSVGSVRFYGKQYFSAEENWQSSVTTYGVCGKFVYDSVNSTVRLPKITGFTEGTINPTTLGDLTEAGLPNITGAFGLFLRSDTQTGAFSAIGQGYNVNASQFGSNNGGIDFNASRSNSIYGNSTTVQPQSIKVLYYICIATSTKTNIEVDIDEIATDLNGKADVDLTNCTKPHIVETYVNGTSWYRVYSDGWCEQGGAATVATDSAPNAYNTITLLKTYANTNYTVVIGGKDNRTTASREPGARIVSTSSFAILTGDDAVNFYWVTCGYIS